MAGSALILAERARLSSEETPRRDPLSRPGQLGPVRLRLRLRSPLTGAGAAARPGVAGAGAARSFGRRPGALPVALCYAGRMQRLFVALRPPAPVRSWLLGLMGGIRGARWQGDEQLHLTLRFVGEVDRHMARDIDAALAAVRHPPVEVTLSGIGVFDRRGRPEALWIGARPPEPLARLHRKVDQALVGCGLAPERRAYLPHVTLARFGREAGPVGPFIEYHGGAASPAFTADSFILFESRLGGEGAAYAELARYPLG